MTQAIDEIWECDLLGRKAEAELLIGYIESIAAQPRFREDAQGFTIAVDAGYGEGKTWFLNRLEKQLALNHPVAFVDAWRDDLADEPLTALVATLKRALEPLIEQQPAVKRNFQAVMAKTGALLKIGGKGLFKTGLKLLLTKEAVEEAETVLGDSAQSIKDVVADGMKDGVSSAVDEAFNGIDGGELMEQRVADFEAGQKAMEELKASLAALVASLNGAELHAPIVVIIDELDRCRPTYAVKLLEEVKHLFDVPGLVFIFGMHKGQLAHSVKAAYGSDFDGQAYLGRFMHRHYRLAEPSLARLIGYQIGTLAIPTEKLWFPYHDALEHQGVAGVIAFYLRRYGLGARAAITVMESLQTCCALTGKIELLMPLLLPMILSKLRGAGRGEFVNYSNLDGRLNFNVHIAHTETGQTIRWWELVLELQNYMALSDQELSKRVNSESGNQSLHLFAAFRNDARGANVPLASPSRYAELIDAVGRFDNRSSSNTIL